MVVNKNVWDTLLSKNGNFQVNRIKAGTKSLFPLCKFTTVFVKKEIRFIFYKPICQCFI